MQYPIIIHKDSDSDYGVTFPDIPGCFSAGTTIEEAINNAQEEAECHIEGMLIDSEPIPAPSNIDLHKTNPDFKNGIWALMSPLIKSKFYFYTTIYSVFIGYAIPYVVSNFKKID